MNPNYDPPVQTAPPVLVVGTGFGCRIQVPALRAAGFEVVGLVGADPARTAERAAANGVAQAFVDLDEAITRTNAVAVAVAPPPHLHAPLVLTALARGCHVLCEKPFARDGAEARTMLQAAQRAGVVHLVGHEFRWTPERATLARAISQGRIGEPRFLTLTQFLQYASSSDVQLPPWWLDPQAGGGWLGAAGSHWVDWIRSWAGEFASVSAALPRVTCPQEGAEDSFVVRFRLANGAEGVLQQTAGAFGPLANTVRIAGTDGTAWLDGETVWIADRQGTQEAQTPPDLALPPPPPASSDPRQQTAEWQMLSYVELAPYTRLCEAWRSLIEGGAPASGVPLPTFADGVACMEVLDAIRVSAANGGALVNLPAG
ncbi:Gfo/Idh/MocA family oxidoreductase [Phenylobacterium sp. LjRoot219]|uniref:Gfo/Idh/MocA family protein n=1 Tax=Phenylobacterium sp. LjRoot219 TaxID=3342283 RepID=UPI003ECD27BA